MYVRIYRGCGKLGMRKAYCTVGPRIPPSKRRMLALMRDSQDMQKPGYERVARVLGAVARTLHEEFAMGRIQA